MAAGIRWADQIYHQLQQTYAWYLESDPSVTSITPNPAHNFADHSPSGTPYLAYSQHLKERYGPNSNKTVKGVINAHSTALHWAWLMAEASRLYGDGGREAEWRAVVTRYHEGSREMFHSAYPDRRFFGLIPYQRHERELTDAQKMNYVDITFSGMPAGYLNTDTYEPEFADVVERASRRDTNPFDQAVESWANAPYAARMARVFPAALAFARPEELNNISCDGTAPPYSQQSWGLDMSSSLSTASLMEVLRYDHNQGMSIHDDPAQFISEGSGRKWILTNTRFQTYWSAGFWEEVDRSRVPLNMQFDIHVTPPPPPRSCVGEHYSVYRVGNKIFMMTDYNGGTMTLELPGGQLPRGIRQLSIKRRTYDETTGRWNPEQPATGVAFNAGPNGKILVHFQQVYRKALTIVEVRP